MKPKNKRAEMDNRENEIAQAEYGRDFMYLPGDIKQAIHNSVLEEFGLRRKFTFKCLDCGTIFEDAVEGELAEIYTDIQSDTHTRVLNSSCQKCKDDKEKKAQEERDMKELAKVEKRLAHARS